MEVVRLPFLPFGSIMFPALGHFANLTRLMSPSSIGKVMDTGGRAIMGFHRTGLPKGVSDWGFLSDFWETGCEATIKPDSQGDLGRVLVEGVRRARLCSIMFRGDLCLCDFEPIAEPVFGMTGHLGELAMYLQSLALGLENTVAFVPMPVPRTSGEFGMFIDTLAFRIASTWEDKITLLREADARRRVEMLHMILARLVDCENERIAEQAVEDATGKRNADSAAAVVPEKPDPPLDAKDSEVSRLSKLVEASGMSDEARIVASRELQRLRILSPTSSEYGIAVTYLDILAGLPWSRLSEDRIDIGGARGILEEEHYGLREPKERILEFLAVRKLTDKDSGAILCFSGSPGVGKTSLCASIAKAMGRVLVRASLGGVRDEAEIRGHRRTYIGALPGRILQELRRAGVRNPVFVLDEIDKLGRDNHGDPASALLEALDPEQNSSFKDNYLGVGFDLSRVLFIATANDAGGLPPALRDRLEIVEIPGYSALAKTHIARRHLIPKQMGRNGLSGREICIPDEALIHIIETYTSEAGVRVLERCCGSIFRKLAARAAEGLDVPDTVDSRMVGEFLGPPKLFAQRMADEPMVGTSTGLAWSVAGGSILFVESVLVPGAAGVETTGNLGQILQESAQVAHSWILANAGELGIDLGSLDKKTIRVHLPAGATPKDGPSAGVALAVSMVSLLSGLPVRNTVAMTGEISLRGRVMPVGGIAEKILTAHRAGIREAIIPGDNADSLSEVPEEVVGEMAIHLVARLGEALDIALVGFGNSMDRAR
jgi:ATP-dependent Lon protease